MLIVKSAWLGVHSTVHCFALKDSNNSILLTKIF